MTPADNFTGYLVRYPEEVTFGDEPAEAVFDRYHAPGFVLVNDGLPLDRSRLLEHVAPARKRAVAVAVEVHDAHRTGNRVAAHYTLTARLRKDARRLTTEIFAFGALAEDGRLARMEQVTRSAEQ
jgi:hypothetical protein